MLTAHATPTMPTAADTAGMFTAADLLDMPDDGHKYEVLEGALVVSPYARYRHQGWVADVMAALQAGAPEGTKVLPGGNIDAGINAPIPDVLAVDDRVRRDDAVFAEPGDVLVVVEVLSPGQEARDRLLKRDLYARIGIPVYWIVDPTTASVVVLRLDGDTYAEAYEGNDLADAAATTWNCGGDE